MRICLLKCGSIYENLKDKFVDYDQMFIDVFRKYASNISFDVFEVFNKAYPEDFSQYDGFLSSGSLSSVYDPDPWIMQYQTYVVRLHKEKKKHVGICFGHQMIAQALGGRVEKARQGWGMGIKETLLEQNRPWMNSAAKNPINLIVSHQDQVVKLPESAKILAGNVHCPVSMFIVDEHTLGIQAHPEFTRAYSRASIERRSNVVDSKIIKESLESLSLPTDENLVIHWIENFFK
jgi:GMP synthase-like glutamine amidotransferase